MSIAKFLKKSDLTAWLKELAADRRVMAPYREGAKGDAIVFRPLDETKPMVLDRQATSPPKATVFPASEEFLRFAYAKSPDNLGQVSVQLGTPPEPPETLVFGGRPCDARGFVTFDRVYDGKKFKDVYYLTRREKTLFATMVCMENETSCFCHWVGSGPADAQGSDLLLTPLGTSETNGEPTGYVIQAVSPRGEGLLHSKLLGEVEAKVVADAKKLQDEARHALGKPPALKDAPEALLARFDDMDPGGFWDEMSAKCISCGACTYLCPTCYCFNITDETQGLAGRRVRSWDTCMSFTFTMEASGHNPRPTKAHRLKNRVGHKFSYYPKIHGSQGAGPIACCGCGRCVKHCPVSVDIREIVLRSMEPIPAKPEVLETSK